MVGHLPALIVSDTVLSLTGGDSWIEDRWTGPERTTHQSAVRSLLRDRGILALDDRRCMHFPLPGLPGDPATRCRTSVSQQTAGREASRRQ